MADEADNTAPATAAGDAHRRSGPAYWRSLDELADTPDFRAFVEKEFPGYSPEGMLSSTRRSFLKIMGASLALAGLTGCRRWPVRKLAPYNQRPEGHTPGEPEFYASAFELDGVAQPILVTAYDGRPIKIEGNPDHPQSRGAASLHAQASILDLYDPHRCRFVTHDGERSTWAAADLAIVKALAGAGRGKGVVVLCEATGSPTLARLKQQLLAKLPEAAWHTMSPGGRARRDGLTPRYRLDEAEVILSLDADFLGRGPDMVRLTREYAASRRTVDASYAMSRLYVAEPAYTITGANADERLAIRSSRIAVLASMIAAELGVAGATARDESLAAHVATVVKDLKAAGPHAVVIAGDEQAPAVHALAQAINAKLRSAHVRYLRIDEDSEAPLPGSAETLLIIGGNPVFDGDDATIGLIASAGTVVHLTHEANETSAKAGWVLPRAHYLEAWGDARSSDGTVSIVQPLIRPLFGGRSAIELIAVLLGQKPDGYALVRATHLAAPGASDRTWRQSLHDGWVAGTGYADAAVGAAAIGAVEGPGQDGYGQDYELVIRRDYSLHDGRFANNGWLQELPDPMTKLVWDNAAVMSSATARSLGVKLGDVVSVKVDSASAELPVYTLPGVAEGVVAVSVGYGRQVTGPVGQGVGVDVYPLLRAAGGATHSPVTISKAGGSIDLATTQNHFAIDLTGDKTRSNRVGHELIRTASVESYKANPDFVHAHAHGIPLPLYGLPEGDAAHGSEKSAAEGGDKHHGPLYEGGEAPRGFSPARSPQQFVNPLDKYAESADYQWGMVIDLNACTGCNACVIACQAENNVPIVGKSQVLMSREMHWLRIDRYFTGDPENADSVRAVHQPVACVHCETAPCEQVCPVAATVHDAEGLNTMVYNRCIGTRYCSNNCPYKVRRFNYFDWNARSPRVGEHKPPFLGIPDQEQLENVGEIERMRFNPEVTVRMRGVMEKCTYCTQRIEGARHRAKIEYGRGERPTDKVADGEIVTACQQTCPAEAITFGNLRDPQSKVAKLYYGNRRGYTLLDNLNTRPRTKYLGRITNPAHGGAADHAEGGEH